MLMEEDRDRPPVADDPGHVGGGGEAADLDRAVAVADQLLLQMVPVDVTIVVLVDYDHVRDGLSPRKLVGVVLVRADEDNRTLRSWDQRHEVITVVEVGRYAQVEDVDHAVDGTRGAGAAKDDRVLLARAERGPNDLTGFFAKPCRLQARSR